MADNGMIMGLYFLIPEYDELIMINRQQAVTEILSFRPGMGVGLKSGCSCAVAAVVPSLVSDTMGLNQHTWK